MSGEEREALQQSGRAGPSGAPRNAGVPGGTESSNLLCSSGESSTNRLGELCGPACQIEQAAVLGISRPAIA
jgi:hypothetical protein